jgi:hypothetical protein
MLPNSYLRDYAKRYRDQWRAAEAWRPRSSSSIPPSKTSRITQSFSPGLSMTLCWGVGLNRGFGTTDELVKTMLLIACAALLSACDSEEQKLDRELAWKDIKPPYDLTTHGVRIGDMTVPGHTQRCTFFLWGIAKEDYIEEGDVPRVFGVMDRDAWLNEKDLHHWSKRADLNWIALEAYNHGTLRVVLTEHKAYAVTSDAQEEAVMDAVDAERGRQ